MDALNKALANGVSDPVVALDGLLGLLLPSGRAGEALEPLQTALELSPDHEGLLTLWAELQLELGAPAETCAAVRRIRELTPDRPHLVRPTIHKMIARGCLDEAQALIESLADDFPDDLEVHYLQACLIQAQGDLPQARVLWEQALEREPGLLWIADRLVRVLEQLGAGKPRCNAVRRWSLRIPERPRRTG